MIVGFLLLIAFVGILFYLLIIYRAVPGAVEQRLGVLEQLPEDVGKWKIDVDSEKGQNARLRGEKREVRVYHNPNVGNATKLVLQARYRNAMNEIVRVDPDEIVKRKRVKR